MLSPTTEYSELNGLAEFSTVVDVFDSLGQAHTITYFFFHTDSNEYTVRGYVNSEDVDVAVPPPSGFPRQVGPDVTLSFGPQGTRLGAPVPPAHDQTALQIQWNNGSDPNQAINVDFKPFTQYASASNILAITQDGQGVGTVGSLNVQKDGRLFAVLTNGQTATIGVIGMANFSNPEGLTRIGNNLLQQSPQSGEPIAGKPASGTFGKVQSGSIELSTVDIASEFVKLITLQRGFQANSRIITTINQLLNEIIQLA